MGTCHPQYGYIILLLNKQDEERYWQIGDGFIQDTSGDVIFKVSFRAIACMPEAGEVLDAKVIEVSNSGIHVQSGPIRAFISMKVSRSLKLTYLARRKTEKTTSLTAPPTPGSARMTTWTRSLKRACTCATASPLSSTSTTIS